MSREYPDSLDPWKAAEGKRSFEGTVPLARMERLAALLAEDKGQQASKDAAFRADFAYDREGYVTIDIAVKARLTLVCQRSLARFVESFDRRSLLAVIEDVADEESVPAHYEPVLVEERRLALAELVEEELLLAVPQVPVAPEAARPAVPDDVTLESSSDTEKEPTHRPFEGLAGLMKTGAGD